MGTRINIFGQFLTIKRNPWNAIDRSRVKSGKGFILAAVPSGENPTPAQNAIRKVFGAVQTEINNMVNGGNVTVKSRVAIASIALEELLNQMLNGRTLNRGDISSTIARIAGERPALIVSRKVTKEAIQAKAQRISQNSGALIATANNLAAGNGGAPAAAQPAV